MYFATDVHKWTGLILYYVTRKQLKTINIRKHNNNSNQKTLFKRCCLILDCASKETTPKCLANMLKIHGVSKTSTFVFFYTV